MQLFDVVVVGAGLAGRLFAIGLAKRGITVASIDHEDSSHILNATRDGRTTAITLGSKRLFENLNLWDAIAPHAQRIQQIRVFENGSPWTLDYDAKDVSEDPMGYIAENFFIRSSLYQHTPDNITVFSPSTIKTCERTDAHATVTLTTGEILRAPLLVAADGRYSKLRSQTNIRLTANDYDQNALVTHIIHEKPHNDTAYEIFTKEGPLAVLPLLDDPETGQHKSGIVWCKPRNFNWASLDDQALKNMFQKTFPYHGEVVFSSKRWTYPLGYTKVSSMIDTRIALLGDAGHVVHPIAGQGVNLGWRDAAILIDELAAAKAQGLDLGSPYLLQRYDQLRKFDRLSVLWATDGISCLYQSQFPPLKFARNAAFAILNRVMPFKRVVMRHAMGII
ncbi:MAG: UbiH/UbiF/VisC/COQ6 family ubiquinone biosynthesis hydroxylase [Candidatus Paracaedibacteraceae bacterium]|nr:UbiH/UbiF/VisC/COQ6 family ubiquinone biosynthesis hydroxylase [Candidatus Paracaedibacteraceae bacterium]